MARVLSLHAMLLLSWLFLCTCSEKEKQETKIEEPKTAIPAPVNSRPSLELTLLNGETFNIKTRERDMVLILFQPDCDHCQQEAEQIRERLSVFKGYEVYFISSHPLEVIKEFAAKYGLADKPNVYFASTSVEGILENFGAIPAPSVYIYNKEGELKESFNGQTDLDVIVKYL